MTVYKYKYKSEIRKTFYLLPKVVNVFLQFTYISSVFSRWAFVLSVTPIIYSLFKLSKTTPYLFKLLGLENLTYSDFAI